MITFTNKQEYSKPQKRVNIGKENHVHDNDS